MLVLLLSLSLLYGVETDGRRGRDDGDFIVVVMVVVVLLVVVVVFLKALISF